MFQTYYGYHRSYRPQLRVPVYYYQPSPRSQPRLNDLPQNYPPYPSQRIKSVYTPYYRAPVYNTRPRYTRYVSQSWEEGGRPSSYKYGANMTSSSLAASSSWNPSNLTYPRATTVESSMAQAKVTNTAMAASSIFKPSKEMIYPQVSTAQSTLNCAQSEMPSSQSSQLQSSAHDSDVAQGSKVTTSQAFEAQVAVTQSVVEQSSTTHSERAQSSNAKLETSEGQAVIKQTSSEQLDYRSMGKQPIPIDRQSNTTQASVTERRKDIISTYPPRNQVGLPQISMAQPRKVAIAHEQTSVKQLQTSVDSVKQSSASNVKQPSAVTHFETSSYPKRTQAFVTPSGIDETSTTQSFYPLRPPPVLRIPQASVVRPRLSETIKPATRIPKPLTRHPITSMTQPAVPSTITSSVAVTRCRMFETVTPPPASTIRKTSSPPPFTVSTTSPPVPGDLKTSKTHPETAMGHTPIHGILPTSATPPEMLERLSNLVQYPVNTSYSKYSKLNCNSPTPVPEQYSDKVNASVSRTETNVYRYQPFSNITNGESQPQNDNESRAKITDEISQVSSRSDARNKWDVKDGNTEKALKRVNTKCVNSSKYAWQMEVDCMETARSEYYNKTIERYRNFRNESNSKSVIENNNDKIEKPIAKLELDVGYQSSRVKSKEKPVYFTTERLLDSGKVMWDDKDPGCSKISEKTEGHIDVYLRDSSDVVDDDDVGDDDADDLDRKDAHELLMSMSNRSIKISRLLEEQKRLMATVSLVKHTPLVDNQSGYSL